VWSLGGRFGGRYGTWIIPVLYFVFVGTGFGPMACVAFGLKLRAWGRWLAAPMGRHQPPCRGVGLAPAVMLGIGLRMWYSASPSMPSFFPYIFAFLSLSLLFRQSLLYDSQFNISIRTRLISTVFICALGEVYRAVHIKGTLSYGGRGFCLILLPIYWDKVQSSVLLGCWLGSSGKKNPRKIGRTHGEKQFSVWAE
jgi:hypothetical protein